MKLESAGDIGETIAPDISAVASAAERRGFSQIDAVLLLGFASPFLLGSVRELMLRSFVMPGVGFATACLATMIVISAGTVYLVTSREQTPLSSIGVNRPAE